MPNLPTLPTLPDELVAGFGGPWPALLEQAGPSTIVPVWATVELDRAAASIAIASRSTAVLDTPLLGARVRVIDLVPGADPPRLIVAEPSTEGRLAAFLARHGEGWAAAYLVVASTAWDRVRAAETALSTAADGPLGTERLVLEGDRNGPFVLLAEAG